MADINNNQPIGIFDSGVGGLSVLIELKRLLPHENFVFLADQLYVPYGEKSKKQLVKLTSRITSSLVKNHNIKMMVVACNTATCSALPEMREKFPIPIVGTVPAIKVAGDMTQTGTVAVISTPSTSQSLTMRKLIKNHCENLNVFNIGCQNLEDTVEHGKLNSPQVNKLLKKYLTDIKVSRADYLVLGCTHYVFLKKIIGKFVGPRIRLVDGNKAIASHTKSLLSNYFLENNQKKSGSITYLTTKNPVKFSMVASKLLGWRVQAKKVAI